MKLNWRIIRISLLLFFVWLLVGWILWLGVLNAPVRDNTQEEQPFEIIPRGE